MEGGQAVKEEYSQISIKLPTSTRRSFNAIMMLQGKTANEVINNFISDYVKENQIAIACKTDDLILTGTTPDPIPGMPPNVLPTPPKQKRRK